MTTGPSLQKLEQLPAGMLEFALLKTTGSLAPRLGRLSFPGRKSILTPGFIGNTSRGAIPHVSQDNFRKSVDLGGVYVALEDCGCIHSEDYAASLMHRSCREASSENPAGIQV